MNATKIKKIAQAAFRSEFGVEPKLKDIHLLEASGDRLYILFGIGKHEYRFTHTQVRWVLSGLANGTLTISK